MVKSVDTEPAVEVLGADDHDMTQDVISANALKVLNRLIDGGFEAYLVGGGVRDALVGQRPKDFDIATDASPEEVRELFRNSRIIGRRFRLVHVLFGRDVVEVATFRAAHDKGDGGAVGDAGQILRDNVYGSIEEDAMRRDFSVNALYYNIVNNSIIDYCGGLDDMRAGVFRLIGDPTTRCEEDPVRVLRAARLSAKLGFDIHPDTLTAMQQTRSSLGDVPAARLFEEMLKLFQGGYAERSFSAIREHGLLPFLFPMLAPRLDDDSVGLEALLTTALKNTDQRVSEGKPITPYYLLSFMLWPDVEQRARELVAEGEPVAEAIGKAADTVTSDQVKIIAIPRRFSEPMREVWALQLLLEHCVTPDVNIILQNRRFRAAYDFLCLRASIDDRLQPLADWWTQYQEATNDIREELLTEKPVLEAYWGESPEQLENLEVPKPPSNERNHGRNSRRRNPRQRKGQEEGKSRAQGSADAEDASTKSRPKKDSAAPAVAPAANNDTHEDSNDPPPPRAAARRKPNSRNKQSKTRHENWDDDNRGNRALPEETEDTYNTYDDIQPEHNANRDASEIFGNEGQTRQRGGRRRPSGNNAHRRRSAAANGNVAPSGNGNARGGQSRPPQARTNATNAKNANGQPRRKKRPARRRPAAQSASQDDGANTQSSESRKGTGQGINGQRRRRSRSRRRSSGPADTNNSQSQGDSGG